MEIPTGFLRLSNKFKSSSLRITKQGETPHLEDSTPSEVNVALDLMKEMATVLDEIYGDEERGLRDKEIEVLDKFKDWK